MIFMSMANTSSSRFGIQRVIPQETRHLYPGQEEFDRLRTLSYADTHVIMLCFSVESQDSLENVREKWWDEIARHCEGILPIVAHSYLLGVKLALVALKCDLREDEATRERLARFGEKCITYEEGLDMARRIHAVRYLGIPYFSCINNRMFCET